MIVNVIVVGVSFFTGLSASLPILGTIKNVTNSDLDFDFDFFPPPQVVV